MPKPRPLPGHLEDHAFSRRTAVDAGLTDGRLQASDLVAPFHGVRVPAGAPASLGWSVRAYQQRMHPEHAFSHATAAALRGLPLPLRFGVLPLHVSCPAPARAPEGRNLVGHQIRVEVWSRELMLAEVDEQPRPLVRLTGAPLTWLLMADSLAVPDLVALGDAILTGGLASEAHLARATEAWGAGRGSRRLRAAVALLQRGAESRPESLLRLQIQQAGLPAPQVNVPVVDRLGRRLFRPDLSWPEYKVLVEYEGDIHRVSREKFRSDITRMERYADEGWHGIRAVAGDVFADPDRFLDRLQRRLIERGLRPRELRHVEPARP